MKMVPNTDTYTKDFIKEGWSSLGFDPKSAYDSSVESTTAFSSTGGKYNYTVAGTFNSRGGYLQSIDIQSNNLSQA